MTALDHNTPLSAERLAEIRRNAAEVADYIAAGLMRNKGAYRDRADLLAEVDRLNKHIADYDRMNQVVDSDWQREVARLKAALADAQAAVNEVLEERDDMEKLLDTFAYTIAPEEVIGEHSSGNDPWQNALDMVTPAAEVDRLKAAVDLLGAELQRGSVAFTDRLRQLVAERDQARETATHMASAMAKVGPAIQRAMRLIAVGEAAEAAAVLGDVAPEAPEGGETDG